MKVVMTHQHLRDVVLVLSGEIPDASDFYRVKSCVHLPNVVKEYIRDFPTKRIYFDLSKVKVLSAWDTTDIIEAFGIVAATGRKVRAFGASSDIVRNLNLRASVLFDHSKTLAEARSRPPG